MTEEEYNQRKAAFETHKDTLEKLNVKDINLDTPNNDIIVEFNAQELTPEQFNYIGNLSEILANDKELEVGQFDLGIFKIKINNLKTYEEELIKCQK